MYHKVNDQLENPVTVPTSRFAEQMALLAELGYTVVGLDAVLAHYVDGAALPPKAVLITFDDGYRDNLENALPALAEARLPGGALRAARLRRRPAAAAPRRASRPARDPQPHARLGRAARARAGRRPDRVARDLPPAARGARDRRVGARDRDLEAAPRGGARPAGARVRLRQGLGSALPARSPEPAPPGRLRPRLHLGLRARTARRATASGCGATTSSRIRRARSSSCSRAPAT